jgi:L-glutamine-phosphate cytidylyltransferase
MKAIILAAGQGSRLLPLTEDTPKCLLTIGDETILGHQIRQLAAAGFSEIVVTTGFRATAVEAELDRAEELGLRLRSLFNPFFAVADNLASCWLARAEMTGEFLLVNGDTLFEAAIPGILLAQAQHPITLTIDRKDDYDSDDMKVAVEGCQLVEVGKRLSCSQIDGEAIGMSWYQGDGPRLFADMLDQMMRGPQGVSSWYLKAINALADKCHVGVASIEGLTWGEVDFPHDLARVRRLFGAHHPAARMVAVA